MSISVDCNSSLTFFPREFCCANSRIEIKNTENELTLIVREEDLACKKLDPESLKNPDPQKYKQGKKKVFCSGSTLYKWPGPGQRSKLQKENFPACKNVCPPVTENFLERFKRSQRSSRRTKEMIEETFIKEDKIDKTKNLVVQCIASFFGGMIGTAIILYFKKIISF